MMSVESIPAATVAGPVKSDNEFIFEKLREFAVFKKQVSEWMENLSGEEIALIRVEIQNDANALYTKLLSVYGLMIEYESDH